MTIYIEDLRDLAKELAELKDTGADPERQAELLSLEEQLPFSLEEYGRNAPTMIEEACFEDYAREFAADTGAVEDSFRWPANHIDWEAAAAQLRMDYTEVTYEGQPWLVRAY